VIRLTSVNTPLQTVRTPIEARIQLTDAGNRGDRQ
jgi:hypothetical protein